MKYALIHTNKNLVTGEIADVYDNRAEAEREAEFCNEDPEKHQDTQWVVVEIGDEKAA